MILVTIKSDILRSCCWMTALRQKKIFCNLSWWQNHELFSNTLQPNRLKTKTNTLFPLSLTVSSKPSRYAQWPGKASCWVLAPPVEGSVGMRTDCSGIRIWLKVGSSTRRFSCLKWMPMLRVVLLPSTWGTHSHTHESNVSFISFIFMCLQELLFLRGSQ